MKKLLFTFIVGLLAISAKADNVTFSVSDGIDNAAIKSKIETSVSKMLTEINAAQEAGRNLNFSAMGTVGSKCAAVNVHALGELAFQVYG